MTTQKETMTFEEDLEEFTEEELSALEDQQEEPIPWEPLEDMDDEERCEYIYGV